MIEQNLSNHEGFSLMDEGNSPKGWKNSLTHDPFGAKIEQNSSNGESFSFMNEGKQVSESKCFYY
jgi:hypothetical protein